MKVVGKLLFGGALVVTGGGLVAGAYFVGFGSGVAFMEWSKRQDEEKKTEKLEAEAPT